MAKCIVCDSNAYVSYRYEGVDVFFCYTEDCRQEAWEILKVGTSPAPIYADAEWLARRKKYRGQQYQLSQMEIEPDPHNPGPNCRCDYCRDNKMGSYA